MVIYLVLFVMLFFFSIHGVGKRMMLLILLALSLILGFRDSQIGVDTINYVDYYNETSDIFEGYMEIGWNIIVVFCKILGLSAYGCNFVVALISLVPFYYLAKIYNDKYINGYVLFFLYSLSFYFLMFNGMRQHCAISVLLIGYYYLSEKRLMLFCICLILASSIHISSLLALAMLFIHKIKLSMTKVIWSLLLSFVIGIFLGEAFFLVVSGKYAHDVEDGLRSGLAFILIMGLLTNLFTIWLYKQNTSLQNNCWVKMNVLSVVVFNLLSNLIIGPRVVYIFSISSVLAFSLYLRYTSNMLVRSVMYLYSIVMFAKFLIPELLIYGVDGSLVPYVMKLQIFS